MLLQNLLSSCMRSYSSITHFLGLTLFSFNYCSSFYLTQVSLIQNSWDGEFSWTLLNGDNKCCQRMGCVGKVPTRFSKHCSVSGLGQVRVRFVLGQVWVRLGLGWVGLGQVWVGLGQVRVGLGQVRFDLCQVRLGQV